MTDGRSSESLRIGAVQFEVSGGQTLESFLRKIEASLRQAATEKVELVIFPELHSADLIQPTLEVADEKRQWERVAREQAPLYFEALQSRETGIAILGGTLPRIRDGGIVNTAALAFPDGRVVLQDKVTVTACERDAWGWQNAGGTLAPFDAPWGRTVVAVCYDIEFPALSQRLVSDSPELFLVPSMTEAIHGFHRVRWCAQARAVEHHAYVVTVGTVGPGVRTPCLRGQFGQAGFFTPCDQGFPHVLREGERNRPGELVTADLDFALLRKSRAQAKAFPAKDQRTWGIDVT